MATLHVLKGATRGERYTLEKPQVILGREARDCDIVIPNQAVSRTHAKIAVVNGLHYIEDLNSRNKTFVNNKQVEAPTALRENDSIKICDFMCTYHVAAEPRKPLPSEWAANPPTTHAEDDGADIPSTVQATIARVPHAQLLETQPADRLRALLDITSALAQAAGSDTLLDRIAEVLLGTFKQADRCFVVFQDGDLLTARAVKVRRPGDGEAPRFSKTIVRNCLDTMQAFLSEDAANDTKFSLSQSITDFRIRSVMCAPIGTADGQKLGVLQVDTQDRAKRFTQDDLKLLMAAANQAAVALVNAQLQNQRQLDDKVRNDIRIGEQVQRSFLPQKLPEVDGYQFYAEYRSALTIGGDYYDFIPLPGGKIAVFLGDVSGKGVPAALLMAKLSCEARFSAMMHPDDIAAAVTALNESMKHLADMDRFVTFIAAVLDPAEHTVTLVNAGHMPPLLYKSTTGELTEACPREFGELALAQVEGMVYNSMTVGLQPGDCLLLYTDGVPDARNAANAEFNMSGIYKALEVDSDSVHDTPLLTPAQFGQRISDAVRQHTGKQAQFDDIAIVSFGRCDASCASAVGFSSPEIDLNDPGRTLKLKA